MEGMLGKYFTIKHISLAESFIYYYFPEHCIWKSILDLINICFAIDGIPMDSMCAPLLNDFIFVWSKLDTERILITSLS